MGGPEQRRSWGGRVIVAAVRAVVVGVLFVVSTLTVVTAWRAAAMGGGANSGNSVSRFGRGNVCCPKFGRDQFIRRELSEVVILWGEAGDLLSVACRLCEVGAMGPLLDVIWDSEVKQAIAIDAARIYLNCVSLAPTQASIPLERFGCCSHPPHPGQALIDRAFSSFFFSAIPPGRCHSCCD